MAVMVAERLTKKIGGGRDYRLSQISRGCS